MQSQLHFNLIDPTKDVTASILLSIGISINPTKHYCQLTLYGARVIANFDVELKPRTRGKPKHEREDVSRSVLKSSSNSLSGDIQAEPGAK